MSKYAPLRHFLEAKSADTVPLTFAEVERVLGFKLPASHRYRAWWSNNGFNNVMTNEWLAAGYKTEQVDIEGRKLVFRRIKASGVSARAPGFEDTVAGSAGTRHRGKSGRHPLIGSMKGMITVAPGTDLTQPADPELADYLDEKYGPESGKEHVS